MKKQEKWNKEKILKIIKNHTQNKTKFYSTTDIALSLGITRQRFQQLYSKYGIDAVGMLREHKKSMLEKEHKVTNLEGEQWLHYFRGYYISNKGRVKRILSPNKGKPYSREKLLKVYSYKGDSYPVVNISKGSKGDYKRVYVHRMVAKRFVDNPKPEEYTEVNHKDKDKTNNNADNLEWVNRQMNMEHSNSKYFVITTPSGEDTIVYNLHKYERDNNIPCGTIRQGSRGYCIKQVVEE